MTLTLSFLQTHTHTHNQTHWLRLLLGVGMKSVGDGGGGAVRVSEASGSHNVLIVCCEIPFQHVIKLSSFPLPPSRNPFPPHPSLPLAAPPRRRGSGADASSADGGVPAAAAAAPSIFHEDVFAPHFVSSLLSQSRTLSAPWSGGRTSTSSSGRLPWSLTTWRR